MITAAQHAGLYYSRRRNRKAALTALADDLAQPAWGGIFFPANPSNGHTITLGGSVITFGTTVVIGSSLSATLATLLVYLLASNDANITQAIYIVMGGTLAIQAKKPGVATMTLAASNATITHATLRLQQHHARQAL